MKRNILPLFSIAIVILMAGIIVGCDKMPENGQLEGMWQVIKVQKKRPDGGYDAINLSTKKCYWSFQLKLAQFTTPLPEYIRHYAHFEHTTDSVDHLIFWDFCYNSENATEADNNEWITPAEKSEMEKWGIYAVADKKREGKITIDFKIKTLNGDDMILETDSTNVLLKKF